MTGGDIMLKVKVFSDFACPYCYLGLCLLEKLREDGIEYEAEWMPFELDPKAPLEGMDLFDVYPKEYVLKALDMLSKQGEEYGIEFNNKNGKFNTRRAHMAGYFAKEKGKYDEYAKAMFKAYFEYGINIADRNEIDRIAEGIGLDVDSMNKAIDSGVYEQRFEEAYNASMTYKIESIPTFIVNEKARLTGIRNYERFKSDFLAADE